MSRHERAAKVGAGLENGLEIGLENDLRNGLENDLENGLEQNASVQLDQEVAHSCPSSCGRSKYNCPVNMQNVLWRAIHQDKYDRWVKKAQIFVELGVIFQDGVYCRPVQ